MTNTNNAATAARNIVSVRVVMRGKSGAIVTTARGPRTHHIAFVLSDGSMMVQKRVIDGGMHAAALSAGRLLQNLNDGLIRRDVATWDTDELAGYRAV